MNTTFGLQHTTSLLLRNGYLREAQNLLLKLYSLLRTMATLLALPNETLLSIIENIFPDDLPNFILSCKLMLGLSKKSLMLYRERRREYAMVEFQGCPKKDNKPYLRTLLRYVIADHIIALYPRSLVLEGPGCGSECAHNFEYSPDKSDNDFFDQEGAERLGSIEKLNRFINDGSASGSSKQRLKASNVELYEASKWGTMLDLLLTTFPNIKTLTVNYFSHRRIGLKDLFWSTFERNHSPGNSGPTILTKLKTVVDASEKYYFHDLRTYGDADIFACFLPFPSVERLLGKYIMSGDALRSSWDVGDDLRLWQVIEINFQESVLSFAYFSQLLSRITTLKRFTYVYSRVSVGIDPYQLIDLLFLHSRTTLEYLELGGFTSEPAFPPNGTRYGDLQGFEALKEICVHPQLWLLSEKCHTADYTKECYSESEGDERDMVYLALVKTLPSCIETVVLRGYIDTRAVNHLLNGITASEGRRLRSLGTIFLRGSGRPPRFSTAHSKHMEVWAEECTKVGISLEPRRSRMNREI